MKTLSTHFSRFLACSNPCIAGAFAAITFSMNASAQTAPDNTPQVPNPVSAERAHVSAWTASKADPMLSKSKLRLAVNGLKPSVGSVRIGLYDVKMSFPAEGHHLEDRVVPVGSADSLVVDFSDLPHGTYAVAAIYDVNGNGRLDYVLGFFPAEPIAFSGGAKAGMFGPPGFDEAKFKLDRDLTLELSMR